MKLFDSAQADSGRERSCCSLEDVEDARSVACRLGIPHYVFNFSECFHTCVIDRFVETYISGGTPNPCIDCNRFLKFDRLLRRAEELGCAAVATGHYARIERAMHGGRWLLRKAADREKDQSYVLYALTQEQLEHTCLPLGEMTKEQVRHLAQEQGFLNARKKDSQDICFARDGSYADFIERYTGRTWPEGDFVDREGRVLGRHRGIIRYTVGQRRGLGLALPQPMYVCEINTRDNTVVLAEDRELYSRVLTAGDINLISVPYLEGEVRLKARVRYRQTEQWATVTQPEENRLRVEFDAPQRAVTRGQAVVLYDGDLVVGGGTIE